MGSSLGATPADISIVRRFAFKFWLYAKELYLYALVGGFVLGLDVLSFWLLINFADTYYLYAHFISRTVGGLFCFGLNRMVTFRIRTLKGLWSDFLKFVMLYSVSFLLSSGLIFSGVQWCRFPEVSAKIAAECIVFLFNYTVMKYWVMAGRGRKHGE